MLAIIHLPLIMQYLCQPSHKKYPKFNYFIIFAAQNFEKIFIYWVNFYPV
jgi:hypothetical protein